MRALAASPVTPMVVLIATLTAALMAPVQARTRDAVMASAFRCAAIGNARTWLDCYYGAAQPQRQAIGLPPALPEQLRLVASPPAGGTIEDQQIRDRVLSMAAGCSQEQEDRQWLRCYYDAARPMRAALGLLPGPSQDMRAPVHIGAGIPAGNEGDIVSRLAAYRFDRYGIFTVTLSNGQIWRQIPGDTSYAHWREPASRYTVTITRGALGSFNLRAAHEPGMFKVKRIA